MTAITRAQKLKARRGRPRLPATNREQNGRKSRREESKSVDQLNTMASIPGIQRRVRDNRLVNKRAKDGRLVTAEQQAQDPRYGYVLGQLLKDRRINETQHATGLRYADDMVRYLALSGLRLPSARAQNLFSVRAQPADETEDRAEAARKARARAKAILKILQDTGNIDQGRRVENAVKAVCLMDIEEARHWSEAQLDHLRLGLNALARKCYGLISPSCTNP